MTNAPAPIAMKPPRPRGNHGRGRAWPGNAAGFSLIELLVVLSIIAIIATLVLPSISAVLRSYNLKSASQNVIGQLNFARQSALANNQSVEVRFYNITDAAKPATTTLRAMQCFLVDNATGQASTTSNPLVKPFFFPAGVIIAPDTGATTTPSLLFNASSGISSSASPDTGHALPPPYSSASSYGTPAYYYFRFRPTGQTTLTAGTTPFFTLYSENSAILANGLPADYATVQIDVVAGTVRIYQP